MIGFLLDVSLTYLRKELGKLFLEIVQIPIYYLQFVKIITDQCLDIDKGWCPQNRHRIDILGSVNDFK